MSGDKETCIYSKELKTGAQINTQTCMFIVALFPIARRWTWPECPLVDE